MNQQPERSTLKMYLNISIAVNMKEFSVWNTGKHERQRR